MARHADPADPVFVGPGSFQARYYLGREPQSLKSLAEASAPTPGAWIVYRTHGPRRPPYGEPLEVRACYEIPSKPWSWVLQVLRAPPSHR